MKVEQNKMVGVDYKLTVDGQIADQSLSLIHIWGRTSLGAPIRAGRPPADGCRDAVSYTHLPGRDWSAICPSTVSL